MNEFKTDAQRLLEQVEKEAAQLKAEKQQKPAHFIKADEIADEIMSEMLAEELVEFFFRLRETLARLMEEQIEDYRNEIQYIQEQINRIS
jgi:hypothetical protein